MEEREELGGRIFISPPCFKLPETPMRIIVDILNDEVDKVVASLSKDEVDFVELDKILLGKLVVVLEEIFVAVPTTGV